MGTAAEDWWTSFHVPEMADLFLVRDDARELQETLDFLIEVLELERGSHLYDQCCGIGSLSIPLAARGMHVTGADLCEEFIELARNNARLLGVDCEFHCADAFEFTPAVASDGVFNWYSSFGYAGSDERNIRMLERAFEALRPGGRFALDVPNFAALVRNFERHIVRRGTSEGRQVMLIRESTISLERGALEQLWTWVPENGPRVERKSRLRLYWPHQIALMLAECGFENIRLRGGHASGALTIDSPRLICTATRPAR
jgi:SAM-dependent methyltransferase